MRRNSRWAACLAVFVVASLARSSPAINILVYDDNSVHQLAATAALNIDAGSVIGNAANFNTLLTSQVWDVVLIDCPSNTPSGGWGPTISYVNGGGRAVMSFWDWDNDAAAGDPALLPAFGLTGANSMSLTGQTLTDTGASNIFLGVSMPNSDWHDHWFDDGDGYTFTLASGTVGLANLTSVAGPVIAQGNNGRTIAAFVIDEAGDTWIADGSGVQLWENMALATAIPEPTSVALLAFGAIAFVPLARGLRRGA